MKIWYDENVEKKKFEKRQSKRDVYLRRLKENDRLRMILFAVPGTAGNIIFALMNGGTGLLSHSAAEFPGRERIPWIYHLCGGALYVL